MSQALDFCFFLFFSDAGGDTWFNSCRRILIDYEQTIESSVSFLYLAKFQSFAE